MNEQLVPPPRRLCLQAGLTVLAIALTAGLVAAFAACLMLISGEALAQGDALRVPREQFDADFPDPAPAPPNNSRLLAIDVGPAVSTRYAIDPSSLLVSDWLIARFTLVATSASGVRNVSFEAIRCDRGERKLLAIGQPDGGWTPLKSPSWVEIGGPRANLPGLKPVFLALCTGGGLVKDTRRALADMNQAGVRQSGGTPGL